MKNCVYSIPCTCGKVYKSETYRPLKVRLENRIAIAQGAFLKNWVCQTIHERPIGDEVKIIDREEHWRIRCFKESPHMLGWPIEQTKYRDEYNMGTNNQKD